MIVESVMRCLVMINTCVLSFKDAVSISTSNNFLTSLLTVVSRSVLMT